MNRRHYLALIGTSIGSLGGCVSQPPGDGSSTPTTATGETTPSPTPTVGTTTSPTVDTRRAAIGETVTVDGVSVTVSNPRVRYAIPVAGAHVLPLTTGVGQWVVVDVTIDGEPAKRLDERFGYAVDGSGGRESEPQATAGGAFGVPFPVGEHDTAAVRWRPDNATAVDWTLPDGVLEDLAATPVFRVTSFGSQLRDGRHVVELAVRNDGERDGQFLGRVSFEGFSGGDLVSFSVPAGGTKRYSDRPGKVVLYFENNGGKTFTLQYPGPEGMDYVEHTGAPSTESPTVPGTETPTVTDA